MERFENMTPQEPQKRSFDVFDCLEFLDEHGFAIAAGALALGFLCPPLLPFVLMLFICTAAAVVVGWAAVMVLGQAGLIVFAAAELFALYMACRMLS